MRTMNRTLVSVAVVALIGFLHADAVSAQLGNASSRTLGLAGNATATARRFEAISVNPAGLGMPGNGFSLALFPALGQTGLGPVTLGDLSNVAGELVPASTKQDWLTQITSSDGETGSTGGELSMFALTVGRMGFQLSLVGGGTVNLNPGIMELLLYGNAGRTGTPASMALSGSTADGWAVTTAGWSVGIPIKSEKGSMAVGATLKYSIGNGIVVGREQIGSLQSEPISVNVAFPVVMTDDQNYEANQGSGVGLDVGFQMERDRLHVGAAVLNVFNTFAWDDTKLIFRSGTASLKEGDNATDVERKAYSSAPAVLKTAVEDMKFDPAVSVGAAYDVQPDFTVSADVRNRFGDGMSFTPKLHIGAGAEYRGFKALHLRGGAAVVTDGFQLAGGASLILGPVNFSFASAFQAGDPQDAVLGQFTLSFSGR
jgi:hypothetical protein